MNNVTSSSLAPARHDQIRATLKERRIARVEDLALELGVSTATIRRDLQDLEQRGHLRRVHGGAVCTDSNLAEPVFDDKASLAAQEKQQIAEAALELIKPTDSIFLDGGSTVLALARLLSGYTQLTVVTNSLSVAGLFSAGGPRTIVVGGELRRLSQTFVGALTRPLLEELQVDTAFMGTIGLSLEDGLSTTDPREALTKETAMQHGRRIVLLADSTKIGTVSFVRFGALEAFDLWITDSNATPSQIAPFERAGLHVRVAAPMSARPLLLHKCTACT